MKHTIKNTWKTIKNKYSKTIGKHETQIFVKQQKQNKNENNKTKEQKWNGTSQGRRKDVSGTSPERPRDVPKTSPGVPEKGVYFVSVCPVFIFAAFFL